MLHENQNSALFILSAVKFKKKKKNTQTQVGD